MPAYKAPLDDIRFVLFDLLKADSLAELPGFADATPDLVAAVLEAAGEFAANELQPINHSGDEEGCHYENGTVTTPKGFKEAYAKFIEGGWTSLPCDPDYGGQGLPKVINFAVEEMICSANLSFGMYPGLSNGAYNALHLHGTDEQKQTYHIPHVSGVPVPAKALGRLRARYGKVVAGVKDSSGDFESFRAFRREAPDVGTLIGDETKIARARAEGGVGTICGMANIAPALVRAMFSATPGTAAMTAACALISGPFLPLLKATLAAQTGHAGWRAVRPAWVAASAGEGARIAAALTALAQAKAAE